ncbi:MAG: SCO family protein [Cytophagales bacterium]|nr:MAG: SCO family protein [Cytophagales bacterium]
MAYWVQKIVVMWLIVLLVSCQNTSNTAQSTSLPYYNTPDFTPIFINQPQEVAQKIPHQIANFRVYNQKNELITEALITGKVHVASFFFSSCGGICPQMMKNMKTVAQKFQKNPKVIFLSFSVAPWIDSVEKLNKYAKKQQIEGYHWHLLTGNKGEIYQLARQSYFAEEQLGYTKDSTEFLHTEHFLLVDTQKRIRGIYNGTLALEMEQLSKDIEQLFTTIKLRKMRKLLALSHF